MSIEKEYYLSCDKCSKIHKQKSDDEREVEEDAVDEGWHAEFTGGEGSGDVANIHYCPDCKDK
jgi:hypothetical protein